MPITLNERQIIQAKRIISRVRDENTLDITMYDALDVINAVLAEIDFSEDANKNITVIQVIQDGKVGYVKHTSCLMQNPIVESAFAAIDYTDHPDALEYDLGVLVTPFDKSYAKSGLRIEHLPVVVVMNLNGEVIDSYIGRMPNA